jgi:hypothetical protein
MAVMSVAILSVKPGRYDDFLKLQSRSEGLLEKAGAKHQRLVVGLTAGEASGSMVSTFETDDFTDFGRVLDKFFAEGGAELMMEIGAADSPIATWQAATYVDVPR